MLQASDGSHHVIDLHQRINNSELLSRLYCYNELARQAVPLSDLRPKTTAARADHPVGDKVTKFFERLNKPGISQATTRSQLTRTDAQEPHV